VSRLATRFAARKASGQKALVTYLVAGDPEPQATLPALRALAAGGADVIELGVPFSDPEAEGPDIQGGCERALRHGVKLRDVLAMAKAFRQEDNETALVLMGYLNSVERMGYEVFAEAAQDAGIDGLIMVNLPPEEAEALQGYLAPRAIDLIFLLAPTTTEDRARAILQRASGFVYYVSLKGTTGAGHIDAEDVAARLAPLRAMTELPIAIGFGIRDAVTARAMAPLGDGIVVGSAVVRQMGALPLAEQPAALEGMARSLREALDSSC
jgi:tryptophan synthase alpha chain